MPEIIRANSGENRGKKGDNHSDTCAHSVCPESNYQDAVPHHIVAFTRYAHIHTYMHL
eukprot:NODE_7065_length_333_cov_91.531690_g6329_i0.p3 GENE.NODE_7065_length_333_cov_91.531690_g6329_i0~~NODE_7065_length_333_cov_91.531690_g6329_i0.p3  ORF type:complete len:58 (+),score=3.47 NODE_7065_length_333_cov_91.531690_g6329_i0:67-240(+)